MVYGIYKNKKIPCKSARDGLIRGTTQISCNHQQLTLSITVSRLKILAKCLIQTFFPAARTGQP